MLEDDVGGGVPRWKESDVPIRRLLAKIPWIRYPEKADMATRTLRMPHTGMANLFGIDERWR